MRSAAALAFVGLVGFVGFAGLVSLAACGGAPAAGPRTAPASRAGATTAPDGGAGAPAIDLLPTLDALAARGPTDAPLMREALRVDHAGPRSPDVRADHDACLRATFAASRPVRAWFADASGAARGETTTSASGTVPPRGPVCTKKGEPLHLVVEDAAPDAGASPAPTARAVIFASP